MCLQASFNKSNAAVFKTTVFVSNTRWNSLLPLGKDCVNTVIGMLSKLGGNVVLFSTGPFSKLHTFDPLTFIYHDVRKAWQYSRLFQPFDAKVYDELDEIMPTVNDTGYQQRLLEGGAILPFVK